MTFDADKTKADLHALLAESLEMVAVNYLEQLMGPDAELEDLRKGVETLVKILGVSNEKSQSGPALPVFHFTIAGQTVQATAIQTLDADGAVVDAVEVPAAAPATVTNSPRTPALPLALRAPEGAVSPTTAAAPAAPTAPTPGVPELEEVRDAAIHKEFVNMFADLLPTPAATPAPTAPPQSQQISEGGANA